MENNSKQKNTLHQQKLREKKTLQTQILKFKTNLYKLKKYRNTSARYFQNYNNFINDFISILESPVINIIQINNIFDSICKTRFFPILLDKYRKEHMQELELKNKDLLDNLNNNDDVYGNIIDEYIEISNSIAKVKIEEHLIDIVKQIYNKFNKLNDKIIFNIIMFQYNFNITTMLTYLNEINYKTTSNKIKKYIYENISFDCFSILDEINIDDLLISRHVCENYYDNISELCQKYQFNTQKDKILDTLISIMVHSKFWMYNDNIKLKYTNIIKWIKENCVIKEQSTLSDINKIKLLAYLNLLIFIETFSTYYDTIDEFTINLNTTFKNNYNIIINELYDTHILNKSDKYKLTDVFEILNIIQIKYYNFVNYKSKLDDVDIKNISKKIWSYDDDNIYRYGFYKITGSIIKKFAKIFILNFMDVITNNIQKEKNITSIYNLDIFNYENNLYSFDEKVKLFKQIYSGKVTTKDIELFILFHNEIANFLIKNITPIEDMIKLAFNCGNINFIEQIINIKYPITLNHITYLQNCNEKQLYNLISCLNKYNTLNYFENFNWCYHLQYIFPDLNIAEIIFDDNNKDLRTELNKKIKEIDEKYIFNQLNKMEYIDFIYFYKTNNQKIKFTIHDIIKFDDYKKRQFILNNIKMS